MGYSDGYRTSLDVPSRMDVDRVKKMAFHDEKILVVSLDDDRIAWDERQILRAIGEKFYGKLKNGSL